MRRMLQPSITETYPEKKHIPRQGYRGEHRIKKDEQGRMKCVACFMCQTACPAECIRIVAGPSPWADRDKIPVAFEIDMLKCIYCGLCEESCPVDAIVQGPNFEFATETREELYYNKQKLLENGDKWETALAENIKADSPFR